MYAHELQVCPLNKGITSHSASHPSGEILIPIEPTGTSNFFALHFRCTAIPHRHNPTLSAVCCWAVRPKSLQVCALFPGHRDIACYCGGRLNIHALRGG